MIQSPQHLGDWEVWISTNKKSCLILLEGIINIKVSAQSHILPGPSVNEIENFILPYQKHLLPPSSSAVKHLSTNVTVASLDFSRKETHRKWSLEPYLQNCMQNIESSCCLTVQDKHPIFYQIPKALCSSKNVQTPWTSHSLARARLGASRAPSALITPFLVSENYLWCSKVTNAQTFCLETSHSPFKPQQTWQAWWSPFGIYLHPNNSDLPLTPYTYSLPKNLPNNRITFSVHAHQLPCKLLEIKNYVIYYHFYYLNSLAQSFTYSMRSINLLNYQ